MPVCSTCNDEGTIERLATPAEVDQGCELGIAYDPCPCACHQTISRDGLDQLRRGIELHDQDVEGGGR